MANKLLTKKVGSIMTEPKGGSFTPKVWTSWGPSPMVKENGSFMNSYKNVKAPGAMMGSKKSSGGCGCG